MSELLRCKASWLLSGIHFLMVVSCLLYVSLVDQTNVIVMLILMILTAPWGFFLMILSAQAGFGPGELDAQKLNAMFVVEYGIGGLINSVILFLLAYLVTKAFRYFMSRES